MHAFPVTRRCLFVLSLVVAGSASSSNAAARIYIPDEVARVTGAECPPPCTICHDNPAGGIGTATTPFVATLLSNGFDPWTPPSNFEATMNAMEIAGDNDTDGDGSPDFDELNLGFDPNPNGARFCGGEGAPGMPTYGCGARIAPRGDIDASAATAAALVALALVRSSRLRRRPSA